MSDESEIAIREMTAWIQDPHEFGVAPSSVQVVESYEIEWPWHAEEAIISLVRYELPDGRWGIGISGPVTWSFSPDEVDFSKFENEELVKLYAGWYLVYGLLNGEDYHPRFDEADQKEMVTVLEDEFNMTDVRVMDRILLGEETFYEIEAVEDGVPCRIAGSKDGSFACDQADKFYCFPALYVFLGFAFYEDEEDPDYLDNVGDE